jgi:hypothetical protein
MQLYVIYKLPTLAVYDGEAVSTEDREEAVQRFNRAEVEELQRTKDVSMRVMGAMQVRVQTTGDELEQKTQIISDYEHQILNFTQSSQNQAKELAVTSTLLTANHEELAKTKQELYEVKREFSYYKIDASSIMSPSSVSASHTLLSSEQQHEQQQALGTLGKHRAALLSAGRSPHNETGSTIVASPASFGWGSSPASYGSMGDSPGAFIGAIPFTPATPTVAAAAAVSTPASAMLQHNQQQHHHHHQQQHHQHHQHHQQQQQTPEQFHLQPQLQQMDLLQRLAEALALNRELEEELMQKNESADEWARVEEVEELNRSRSQEQEREQITLAAEELRAVELALASLDSRLAQRTHAVGATAGARAVAGAVAGAEGGAEAGGRGESRHVEEERRQVRAMVDEAVRKVHASEEEYEALQAELLLHSETESNESIEDGEGREGGTAGGAAGGDEEGGEGGGEEGGREESGGLRQEVLRQLDQDDGGAASRGGGGGGGDKHRKVARRRAE